jgi:hypothetical protein
VKRYGKYRRKERDPPPPPPPSRQKLGKINLK